MWNYTMPFLDTIIRAVFLYLFLFILVRLMGKKQLIKLSPFDILLLIVVSNVIQNGVGLNDRSIIGASITIATLYILHTLTGALMHRYSWFEKLIMGEPEVIILNGKIHKRVMRREKITEAELYEALREHEIMHTDEVKCAILEADGKISVIKYSH